MTDISLWKVIEISSAKDGYPEEQFCGSKNYNVVVANKTAKGEWRGGGQFKETIFLFS